jgi:hypothetical protein
MDVSVSVPGAIRTGVNARKIDEEHIARLVTARTPRASGASQWVLHIGQALELDGAVTAK